jgi:membrane-associated phospholipid phosphatase
MVVRTETPDRLETNDRVKGMRATTWELLVGCFLLGVATLAGFLFVRRPWPNRLDAIGFRILPGDPTARWAVDVAHIGSLTVLVAGVLVLCAVAAISRNWMRALSCLIGPMVAVLIVETVAKPFVGRQLEGSLSYPSGTVTAVTALAAAGFLVAPRFAKLAAAVAGGVVVAVVCAAVVELRWHFPTDALGGVCVGAGAVFAVDGLLRSNRSHHFVRVAFAVLRGRRATKGVGTPTESADSSEAVGDRPLEMCPAGPTE